MASIARKLNEPELVVSFQRLCGIVSLNHVNSSKPHPTLSRDASPSQASVKSSRYGSNKEVHIAENSSDADTVLNETDGLRERVHNGHTASECNGGTNRVLSNGSVDLDDRTGSSSSEDDHDGDLEYVITNKFLHYLFEFGASMGNEVFYITFFPYWFWNIDGYVGRRVCIFWCLFMYLGQAAKDIIKWPRPASPPVIRLEKRYALEYSMPSTHAMVGAGLPVSLLIITHERYEVGLMW